MRPKVMFNTLKYAKLLDKGGVDKSEIYTRALEQALSENLYMASEVDAMYNNLVTAIDKLRSDMNHRFEVFEAKIDNRFEAFEAKIDRRFESTKAEISEMGNKLINRMAIYTGSAVAVLTLVSAILHYTH